MEIFKTLALGLVQGLTEFLPISSSAHLTIFQEIFGMGGMEGKILLDVMLHIGTLVSVCIVFWEDVKNLFIQFFSLIADLFRGRPNLKNPYRRMLVMLMIATLPLFAAVIFQDQVEAFFHNLTLIGITLMITGVILYVADRLPQGRLDAGAAPMSRALIVGIGQMFAVIPGLSRSGTTISAAQAVGFTRRFAVKFSFLMSIIAILGAALVQVPDAAAMAGTATGAELGAYAAGMTAAALSGIFAIKFLVKLINNGKLHYFSYYCWAVGILVIAYQIFV